MGGPHDLVNLAEIYGVPVDAIVKDNYFEKKTGDVNAYNSNDLDLYLSQLDNYEKLLIMNIRLLSLEDKKKFSKKIYEILHEQS